MQNLLTTRGWATTALSVLLAVLGLVFVAGGARLVGLGGSWYYLLSGVGLLVAAALLCKRRYVAAALLYAAGLLATLLWALVEVGLNAWPLAPRLILPAMIGLLFLLPTALRRSANRPPALAAALCLLVLLCAALKPAPDALPATASSIIEFTPSGALGEWPAYGRDQAGTRFSPLTQITPENVSWLKPAWTYRTGVVQPGTKSPLETTPLMVGDRLFLCTQTNIVIALDPETGEELWRFDPQVDATGASSVTTCRGVVHAHVEAPPAQCPERILTVTFDARLIALNADTGQLCPGFGQNGVVDLKEGMGEVLPGFYYASSPPALVRGNIVLGGWVADNQNVDVPSGVIRAFDVVSGKLNWAWDAGNPDNRHGAPVGHYYTRGTPNSWAAPSADEALGLVYIPTGNPSPDHFGGQRTPADEQYGSAVVALDALTGEVRWSFRTAYHDLWDYDIASQPTLVDVDTAKGRVQALLQATKRGELFLLDRRNGQPVADVVEKPAPTRGAVPEERMAPVQPYSVGMPSFAGDPLTERDMWGATPLDQLWCRIRFRQLRYDGHATPPGLDESLIYPSIGGGMNYGGVAVDPERGIVIVNSMYYGTVIKLIPREDTDRALAAAGSGDFHGFDLPLPQTGTPYGAKLSGLMSPLNTPCNAPPYGKLSAVDVHSGKLLWSRPIGTLQDSGPFGLSLGVPIPMGMPGFGGSVVTRSGLTFTGFAREHAFRAFETATGKEVWRARLPTGAHANPITYISPKSGRQFVVVAAGGHTNLQSYPLSDAIVAFALPED
ncbi:membrane-bound PQQ-dependent dehydrogenase, glucose/quinate/shikimate family [Pseudomonas aeruginosa]